MLTTGDEYLKFKYENRDKKIAIIYGNCHTTAIRQLLCSNREFSKTYAMFPIKAIQEVKDSNYFRGEVFSECDLFIHQSIQENNRYGVEFSSKNIMERLKDSAEVLAVPNVYHLPMCYFPQYKEEPEIKGPHGGTFFFRDAIIDNGIKRGMSVNEIINDYKVENHYSKEDINNLYQTFIGKVRKRESDWDIKVSDYIYKSKDKVLFFDPNHPTPLFISYICENILYLLGLNNDDFDYSQMRLLDAYQMPICQDVIDFFGLKYDLNTKIRQSGNKLIRGEMTIDDYVKQYIALLWTNDDYTDWCRRKSKVRYCVYKGVNLLKKVL